MVAVEKIMLLSFQEMRRGGRRRTTRSMPGASLLVADTVGGIVNTFVTA
jgi:hypothetical protein